MKNTFSFIKIFKDLITRKSAGRLALLGGSEPNLKTPPRRRPIKK
jgi:hypothetical protein